MKGSRKHPFAGPALPTDQDDGIGWGYESSLIQNLLYQRVGVVEFGHGHLGPHLVLQVGDPIAHPAHLDDALQGGADLVGCERLGQVVDGPPPHRFDDCLESVRRGDHHHREAGTPHAQSFEQVQSRVTSKTQVDEGHVVRPALDQLESARPGSRLVHGVLHRLQGCPQGAPGSGSPSTIKTRMADHLVSGQTHHGCPNMGSVQRPGQSH